MEYITSEDLEQMGYKVIKADASPDAERYKTVTVDGITLTYDSRAIGDINTLRLIGKVSKGGVGSIDDAFELFDIVFGESVKKVDEALREPDGYIDSNRYLDILVRALSEAAGKN